MLKIHRIGNMTVSAMPKQINWSRICRPRGSFRSSSFSRFLRLRSAVIPNARVAGAWRVRSVIGRPPPSLGVGLGGFRQPVRDQRDGEQQEEEVDAEGRGHPEQLSVV